MSVHASTATAAAVLSTLILTACGGSDDPAPAPPAGKAIVTAADTAQPAPFDVVRTEIVTTRDRAIFRTKVRAAAGSSKPASIGSFAGSEVYAYVWPTTLNSADIGFDKDQGIVALAATFHPDFDDGAYGARNRDKWHSHWVVLVEDKACGAGLKVKDIPDGAKPTLPPTWPGAPILLDSPDYDPTFAGDTIEVRIPLSKLSAISSAKFDGVTAGLRVDGNLHAPLLCVANVFKIASGKLSLPGEVGAGN
jgi:hypothetical protein